MTSRAATGGVLLVDSATSGCAGAYIDAIYQAIRKDGPVEVAVSHYYPYPYGKKLFYKYSELTAQGRYRLGRARLYVRFLELVVAFIRLFASVLASRPAVVCYAISSNLTIEYLFLLACRHLGRARIHLICHDVIPFVLPGEDGEQKREARRKFYVLADRLIVHNQNSIDDLTAVFDVPTEKIVGFPFPLFDFEDLGAGGFSWPWRGSKRFLFIGHMRPEKGIDLLLSAWTNVHAAEPSAELLIAGNLPADTRYDFRNLAERNITLRTGYLSDAEYVGLIRSADCVVLPYIRGTNSGIASTVVSMRTPMIVSDIGMFTNNPLIPDDSFFKSGDREALVQRILAFQRLDTSAMTQARQVITRRAAAYEAEFEGQVRAVFSRAVA